MLRPEARSDKLVWHYEKSGIFYVRSAYHMGMNYMERDSKQGAITSSSKGAQAGSWKLLWRCTVPPMVRLRAWKIWHDIVPTKINLKKGIGLEDISCPHCSAREEDSAHGFFFCPAA